MHDDLRPRGRVLRRSDSNGMKFQSQVLDSSRSSTCFRGDFITGLCSVMGSTVRRMTSGLWNDG